MLIVLDEAHRATGAYAYATAIRDMMIFNPNFRVLALTATPGSNREAVQAVVDSMHISHIEIRDEQALDLREYIHRKVPTQLSRCKRGTLNSRRFLNLAFDTACRRATTTYCRDRGRHCQVNGGTFSLAAGAY